MRFLLRHGLADPLGMADSAKWATGASEPYAIAVRHDFWNTSLGTMALLEWLDGDDAASRTFAALPEVRDGLDHVFRVPLAKLHTAGAKHEDVQVAVQTSLPKADTGPKAAKTQVMEVSKRN
jgi:hypothetical protein